MGDTDAIRATPRGALGASAGGCNVLGGHHDQPPREKCIRSRVHKGRPEGSLGTYHIVKVSSLLRNHGFVDNKWSVPTSGWYYEAELRNGKQKSSTRGPLYGNQHRRNAEDVANKYGNGVGSFSARICSDKNRHGCGLALCSAAPGIYAGQREGFLWRRTRVPVQV